MEESIQNKTSLFSFSSHTTRKNQVQVNWKGLNTSMLLMKTTRRFFFLNKLQNKLIPNDFVVYIELTFLFIVFSYKKKLYRMIHHLCIQIKITKKKIRRNSHNNTDNNKKSWLNARNAFKGKTKRIAIRKRVKKKQQIINGICLVGVQRSTDCVEWSFLLIFDTKHIVASIALQALQFWKA